MTASSGKQLGVGLRHAVIFELNSSGSPAATDTTAYEGNQIVGAQAYDLTIPDPRKITHVGDDRPLQVDYLPPNEAMSAELRAARDDFDVLAILSSTSQVTVGEAKVVGLATDQQGSEPQVGLLCYQQALDDSGQRSWRWYLLPKATVYVHPKGMDENASEHRYMVSPAVVSAHMWETAFASGTEGFTQAQMLLGMSEYKPKIVAFLASTADTTFTLPSSYPAAATGKMVVWVDGTEQTSGVTKATDSIEFTTAPGNNKRVVVFYEHNQ